MATALSNFHSGPIGYKAASALTEFHLVAPNSSGKWAYNGAGETPSGWLRDPVESDEAVVPDRPWAALCIASASIAVNDYVKGAANGEIAPEASVAVRTAVTLGRALSAGDSGDKVLIEFFAWGNC